MRTEKEKLQREIIDALYDKYNNKEYCTELICEAMDIWHEQQVNNLDKADVSGSALNDFLTDNLEKSRPTCTEDNPFMMGWVAGLLHVRCNWLNFQKGCEHYR